METQKTSEMTMEAIDSMIHPIVFQWSQKGDKFLFGFQDEPQYPLEAKFAVCSNEGQILWQLDRTKFFLKLNAKFFFLFSF